ncbi:hypothetical protein QR680_017678 [Steinernema hermaphroditum]|uniref:Protein kinase domain-containing protein n=1 Tax=Steinernema hermaphroditum TaxID=289476 RepID=A0AA39HGE6_9BILA|nr:hypothetical protein QR680_017678 [Steinernema hermaphroditum]
MQQVPEQWLIKSSHVKLAKDKQKPISTGNFADVYLGTLQRKRKNLIVAVKMSKATIRRSATHSVSISTMTGDDQTKDEMSLNEMSNEAMIMSLMHHTHVIEFFGVSLEKAAMIIMEYCLWVARSISRANGLCTGI